MFSPINFLVTLIKEIATESPRAYTPFRLAVKSSQPLLGALLLRRTPSLVLASEEMFCKDNAIERNGNLFLDCRVQFTLCKDSANRMQNIKLA